MSRMTKRLLADHEVPIADAIIDNLVPLPPARGITVLLSILAATLNNLANDELEAATLYEMASQDLCSIMQLGRDGLFPERPFQ